MRATRHFAFIENSIKTCPDDGLKELFAVSTHRINRAGITFRFRHFEAAFARVAKEKPVHGAYALA